MASYPTSSDNGHFSHPDYEFLGEISRGGMGVIYRARHKLLKIDRAFKLILTDKADQSAVKRFEREARALAELKHPHILTIHDYGNINGSPYLVTDLIDGRDLESHLNGNPLGLNLDWLSERLTELASALAYCHEQGIAHRDFKPANVIIRRDTNQAVLIDFGLVKKEANSASLETLSKTGDLIGTPEYMAPEQFDNSGPYGAVGPKSDVWSIGVLLYYCLTGRQPFQGGSIYHYCSSVLQGTPDPIQSINKGAPPRLVALTMDCLKKDGRERPTMAEVKSRLNSLEEPERAGRKLLTVSLTIAIGFLLVGSVSALFYSARDKTPPQVTLKVPNKGLYHASLKVTGLVFEDGCKVTLNGKQLSVVDRQFYFNWPLSKAGTTYRLKVLDGAGNSSIREGVLTRRMEVFVGASEDCEFKTISEAIEAVPESVKILVREGEYKESLLLKTKHHIKAEILGKTVLISRGKQSCVVVKAGAPTLEGFSLRQTNNRGKEEWHGVIVEEGTLTLNDCELRSDGGNGILVTGDKARLLARSCKINGSHLAGLALSKAGSAKLENCSISKNTLFNVICEESDLRLKNCRVNSSSQKMGLLVRTKSTVRVEGCLFRANSCQAVRVSGGGKLFMEDCEIQDTKPAPKNVKGLYPYSGAGVYGHGGTTISLKSCKISGNGGIGVWGNRENNTILLSQCEIYRNNKSGLWMGGSGQHLEMTDCKIYENAEHGLKSKGKNTVSMKRVKALRNKEHGYYFGEGTVLKAQDCEASFNRGGGFAILKQGEGILKNCLASQNLRSGFIVIEKSRFEAVNCRANENRRGVYGRQSQLNWVGGEIRDNRDFGFGCRDKAFGVIKDLAMSGNKRADIKIDRQSTVELIGFSGTRKRPKVEVDSSSRLVEGKR